MAQVIQSLKISLKGGQTVEINVQAPQPDHLTPQIDAFLKMLADPAQKDGHFIFRGARIVYVRLADVSAADVVSLVRKEAEEQPAEPKQAEEKKAEQSA